MISTYLFILERTKEVKDNVDKLEKIDEDGTTYHGPTGYGIEDIIREYSRSISTSMKK